MAKVIAVGGKLIGTTLACRQEDCSFTSTRDEGGSDLVGGHDGEYPSESGRRSKRAGGEERNFGRTVASPRELNTQFGRGSRLAKTLPGSVLQWRFNTMGGVDTMVAVIAGVCEPRGSGPCGRGGERLASRPCLKSASGGAPSGELTRQRDVVGMPVNT